MLGFGGYQRGMISTLQKLCLSEEQPVRCGSLVHSRRTGSESSERCLFGTNQGLKHWERGVSPSSKRLVNSWCDSPAVLPAHLQLTRQGQAVVSRTTSPQLTVVRRDILGGHTLLFFMQGNLLLKGPFAFV